MSEPDYDSFLAEHRARLERELAESAARMERRAIADAALVVRVQVGFAAAKAVVLVVASLLLLAAWLQPNYTLSGKLTDTAVVIALAGAVFGALFVVQSQFEEDYS